MLKRCMQSYRGKPLWPKTGEVMPILEILNKNSSQKMLRLHILKRSSGRKMMRISSWRQKWKWSRSTAWTPDLPNPVDSWLLTQLRDMNQLLSLCKSRTKRLNLNSSNMLIRVLDKMSNKLIGLYTISIIRILRKDWHSLTTSKTGPSSPKMSWTKNRAKLDSTDWTEGSRMKLSLKSISQSPNRASMKWWKKSISHASISMNMLTCTTD